MVTSLKSAISFRLFSFKSPSRVAFTTFTGFLDPRDLARISATPAFSTTDLTFEPAIRPVPGVAGLRITVDDL